MFILLNPISAQLCIVTELYLYCIGIVIRVSLSFHIHNVYERSDTFSVYVHV
jgi:hypothetical protein